MLSANDVLCLARVKLFDCVSIPLCYMIGGMGGFSLTTQRRRTKHADRLQYRVLFRTLLAAKATSSVVCSGNISTRKYISLHSLCSLRKAAACRPASSISRQLCAFYVNSWRPSLRLFLLEYLFRVELKYKGCESDERSNYQTSTLTVRPPFIAHRIGSFSHAHSNYRRSLP